MGTTLLAGFKSEIEIYDPDLIAVSLMSGISHSALCLNIEVQKCDIERVVDRLPLMTYGLKLSLEA